MRQKSNWLFAQIIILGTIITILIAGLFYKIYNFTFGALGNITLNRIQNACGCQIPSSANNSVLTGFAVLLGSAIVISFIFALSKIIISLIKTKKFISLQKINFVKSSKKLTQVAATIGIQNQVVEINTTQPLIFCHGLKSEKIYISSTVVKALSFAQLQTALLHETHHLLTKEPARLLILKLIGVFGFIPGINSLIKKYLSFSEIAADELATDNFKEKNHLAAAMAKILELEEKNIIQKELAVSFFSQMTEERVVNLSEAGYKPTFKTELLKAAFGIAGAAIFILFFSSNLNVQQSKAQEIYTKSGCAEQIYKIEKCQNGWTKCAEQNYHQEKTNCQKSIKYFDKLKN